MKTTGSDRTFTIVNEIILGLFLIIILYPLIYIISASFSSGYAVTTGRVWLWPVDFNLEGYKAVFKHDMIATGYLNSLFYMFIGTVINVGLTIMAAYPLSRKDFKIRNIIMFLFVFTMMFKPGMIPDYLLIKNIGLLDSRWALLLPKAILVYNLIITRTYFQTNISDELLEASKLDGCTDFQFLRKIVIPLSKPIISVIVLLYAVGHWNRYFDAMLYISSPSKMPLQIILRDILITNQIDSSMLDGDVQSMLDKQNLQELLKYSLIILSSLPLLILYPLIQKFFEKGIMVGSIKG
ncbi:MAG: carbohydrate ABC transporter permease [Vallitalea sp.]|jgi:multiple sugar transport system permease protein/putative aldouronate transport system permease protein|nr:carbohydrate ABC transporter permease [Vallitalea sp.]